MNLDNIGEFVEDSEYEISKRDLIAENIRFSVFFDTITQDGEVAIKDYMSISPKSSDENQITGVKKEFKGERTVEALNDFIKT